MDKKTTDNSRELRELLKAMEAMLACFDREGSAPRKDGLSIGASTCDRARAALKNFKAA